MNKKHGFSLVELSIVLIIIGLLIGGVVAGMSLKRDAQIQAVISDFGKYKQSAIMFKEKYNYWPGDLPNAASTYWATAGGDDGNGNGQIGGANISSSHPAAGVCADAGNQAAICDAGESFYAIRELVAAGFTVGDYAGGTNWITQFPKAPIDPADGINLNNPIYIFTYSRQEGLNKNVFSLTDVSANSRQSGAVVPSVGYSIDQKIDDRIATSGNIRGFDNASVSSTCLNGSEYDVENDATYKCIVSYIID